MKKITGFALLASSILSSSAGAEILKNVSIEGTHRFEPASIMRNLNLSQGQDMTPYELDKITKTLIYLLVLILLIFGVLICLIK